MVVLFTFIIYSIVTLKLTKPVLKSQEKMHESFEKEYGNVYDKLYNIYLVKNPSKDWCNPIEFYNNTNTTECEQTQKFFEKEELSYLYEKPIFDNTHELVFYYANGWTIDPQYIKDNYSTEYYTENADGSINIELVMYFKPQSYFYLGLIISGIILLLCIICLIINKLKQRRNKRIEVY